MSGERAETRVAVGLRLDAGPERGRIAEALLVAGFAPMEFGGEFDGDAPDEDAPAAWIVDAGLPDFDWSTLCRAGDSAPAVIVLASFGSIGDAVTAMRRGAADYLTRPIVGERLVLSLRRALEGHDLRVENARLKETLGERFDLGRIVSRDPRMLDVKRLVESVGDTRAHLLITGESGTGKTMLARAIHQRSARAKQPFVEVNCGALPITLLESELFGHVRGAFTGAIKDKAGRFEAADGGTLFLDEIANAPLELQIKLLRVLQDKLFERVGDSETRQVDVRVIAATNRDLRDEVKAGRFREDLYWRLAVVPIHLPPLRERPRDLPLLVEAFLERAAEEHGRAVRSVSPEALLALCRARWPGNVRELENTLERAVLLARGEEIRLADLGPDFAPTDALRTATPGPLPAAQNLKDALAEPERELIRRALAEHDGCRKATAAALGVNRTTLFNKMRKHGLLGIPARPTAPSMPGLPLSEPAT
ncbi:MAG: sigma 54-interacting transcriptional regulator [Planctomycetes bacterium]|nr:sigma 54-interacting transcriptional regulator [Planctomycetota bacterium]